MRISADDLSSALHNDLSPYINTGLTWSVDNSVREVMCYRLNESLVKKFNQADRPSRSACDASLSKFLDVNERCSKWHLHYQYTWEEELVNELRRELADFWYCNADKTEPVCSTYDEVFNLGRTGPGASRLAVGTDMYSKLFCSPLSCTSDLADIWRVCASRNVQLTEAWSHPSSNAEPHIVEGNSISFVNKTTAIARPIATEPLCNMWFQLGFGLKLEDRLSSRFAIDLRVQPEVNRLLAMKGSLDRKSVV